MDIGPKKETENEKEKYQENTYRRVKETSMEVYKASKMAVVITCP